MVNGQNGYFVVTILTIGNSYFGHGHGQNGHFVVEFLGKILG